MAKKFEGVDVGSPSVFVPPSAEKSASANEHWGAPDTSS